MVRDDCLKPFHIQEWIDSFDLSSGSKRNYARAVTRCMNWCEEQGLIERSPLAHFDQEKGFFWLCSGWFLRRSSV